MAGTFEVTPHILTQLYAPLDNGSVSGIGALLSGKSKTTYQELLTAVFDLGDELGDEPDPSPQNSRRHLMVTTYTYRDVSII